MKTIVISYSLTGNNETLAENISSELAAEHIKITELKPRTVGTIMLDGLFNRTPQVTPAPDQIVNEAGNDDLVLFVGPVWLGKAASPFREYFKKLKNKPLKYGYISISGGALNPNPKLSLDLKKRTKKEPAALIDMHIADLLPPVPKPTMNDTSSYRLNDKEVIRSLTDSAVKAVRGIIA